MKRFILCVCLAGCLTGFAPTLPTARADDDASAQLARENERQFEANIRQQNEQFFQQQQAQQLAQMQQNNNPG